MPRLPTLTARYILPSSRQSGSRFGIRPLSTTTPPRANDSDATSGWKGRHGDEHAVKRDGLDVQSEQSHKAVKEHESLEEGSQAISRKDEGDNNKRAKEDHPEAPGPVIGMNDERGSVRLKAHKTTWSCSEYADKRDRKGISVMRVACFPQALLRQCYK